jgi:hypothetical protein
MIIGFVKQGFGMPVETSIRAHYPITDSLRLAFGETIPYDERRKSLKLLRKQIESKLPARVEGLSANAKLRETHLAIVIERGGMQYAPPWQDATVSENAVGFVMPMDVFDRFLRVKARLHLELLAEDMRPARVVQTTVAEKFSGPMDGTCLLIQGKVYCRYPYKEWVPARAVIEGCGGKMAVTLRHVPAGGMLDPVVSEELPFSKNICVGDAIRFTEYGVRNHVRVALDVPAIEIAQYRTLDR